MGREYSVRKSCLRIDLETAVLEQLQNMSHPRIGHSAAMVGNSIYVAGGFGDNRRCERFSLQKQQWTDLSNASDFDQWGEGVTLVAVKSAYLLAIGGCVSWNNYPDFDRLRRLDVRRPNRRWEILTLAV